MKPSETVLKLLKKGVTISNPFSIEIGEEVNLDRISAQRVVLYGGTRIAGKKTLISAGVKLGEEAPVTIDNCMLGSDVELKGGFFSSSIFLERASMASGAQVRTGCLLEEEANAGHNVGLKQTILFPFVTLGSLINFCDVFMSGGTSRRNHSEVGSSYIHFNYTPNQDKATASLLGDVPGGVMLKEPPIFLGGQGGLVGPARICFGTVIAAGKTWRGDCLEGGKLFRREEKQPSDRAFYPGLYADINRRVINNIFYIANLLALRYWYVHVRSLFFQDAEMGAELLQGAMEIIEGAIKERLFRFKTLAEKMEKSIELGRKFLSEEIREKTLLRQREFYDHWDKLEEILVCRNEEMMGENVRDRFLLFLSLMKDVPRGDYLRTISALDNETSSLGTKWLQMIVDDVAQRALSILPSFRI